MFPGLVAAGGNASAFPLICRGLIIWIIYDFSLIF